MQHPKKGLSTTRSGTLLRHAVPTRSGPPDTTRPRSGEADTVAHCDDTTEGDYVNALTFTNCRCRPARENSFMSSRDKLDEFTAWCGKNISGDEKGQAQTFLDRYVQSP